MDEPFRGRNEILKSFCPQVCIFIHFISININNWHFILQIYGLYPIKLAVALAIAGGVRTKVNDQTTMRGESHLLLVGDPGKRLSG